VTAGAFATGAAFKRFFYEHQGWGLALWLALLVALAAVGVYALTRAWRRPDRRNGSTAVVVGVVALFGLALVVFYAWFGFSSYLSRYLAPVAAVTTLLIACAIGRFAAGRRRRVLLSIATMLVAVAVVTDVQLFRSDESPRVSEAAVYAGLVNVGYRDAIDAAIAEVPRGSRVGGWQSGALAYFAEDRLEVLNLDGVVNPDSPPTGRDDLMAAYIRDERIDWLVDWAEFQQPFITSGRFTLTPVPGTKRVGSFEQSNGVSVVVVRITWDMASELAAAFENDGRALLEFQRATAELSSGTPPSRAACRRLAADTFPQHPPKDELARLTSLIPDDDLARMFLHDIDGRFRLLYACAQPAPLPDAARAGVTRLHDGLLAIQERLARHGLDERFYRDRA
jgi:hypothetical protein